MMLLTGCVQDLDIAERAIQRMAEARLFPDLYEAWQDFLYRTERSWEQAERVLRTKKGFQQWFKPYADLRKKDALLRFLRQARHAETHAVSSTVEKPIMLLFRDKLGRPFSVSQITTTFKDGTLTINVDTPDVFLTYDASVLPTDPKLVRFKNRGKWYNPPKSHLGNGLQELHPVIAAKLGLQFYRGFIQEAINKFYKPS